MKYLFFLSIIFLGCPDNGVQPPTNPLQLTVEDVSCTEAYLKLSLAHNESNRTVTLKRGDSSIAIITMAGSDSLFVDEELLPNKTYTYTLATQNFSVTAQATTQDTTSHDIQWQLPDTLGAYGLIRDVWVFSKTNAWAVGDIFLRDSTGSIDNGTRYNVCRWDGNTWKVMSIKYNCRLYFPNCGPETMLAVPVMSIFAFATNDIWIAAGSAQHFDGTKWTEEAGIQGVGSANKIWGGGGKLWFVGNDGFIAHRNTSGTWTKQESHTTVDLQDIWGIDDNHIWATGLNSDDGHSVVLQYDGKQWTTIYDNTNATPSTLYYFNTLWTDNVNYLYLDGGGLRKLMTASNFIGSHIITGQTYPSYRLRSTLRRDMFDVGQASEVAHFNGVSWYLYPELKAINDGFAWFYSVHPTKDFILIGGVSLTVLNGFPVVIRGYR